MLVPSDLAETVKQRCSTFLLRSWSFVLLLLRSRLVAELRCLFDLRGSRSLPLYLDYLASRVIIALFDALRLACFGTRLPGHIGIRVLYSAAAVVFSKKVGVSAFFPRFSSRSYCSYSILHVFAVPPCPKLNDYLGIDMILKIQLFPDRVYV